MPTLELTLTVPPALKGKRLDQALAALCPEHSRSRLQDWIKSGNVRVNNTVLRQRDVVQGGENIDIHVDIEAPAGDWPREAIPLDIVHQDEHILVINKPPGLVVHPGAGNPAHTLLNALLYHLPELTALPRAGIVQRLDKDTSGLMVIALTTACDSNPLAVDEAVPADDELSSAITTESGSNDLHGRTDSADRSNSLFSRLAAAIHGRIAGRG